MSQVSSPLVFQIQCDDTECGEERELLLCVYNL